jgi:hypothetical protein
MVGSGGNINYLYFFFGFMKTPKGPKNDILGAKESKFSIIFNIVIL